MNSRRSRTGQIPENQSSPIDTERKLSIIIRANLYRIAKTHFFLRSANKYEIKKDGWRESLTAYVVARLETHYAINPAEPVSAIN